MGILGTVTAVFAFGCIATAAFSAAKVRAPMISAGMTNVAEAAESTLYNETSLLSLCPAATIEESHAEDGTKVDDDSLESVIVIHCNKLSDLPSGQQVSVLSFLTGHAEEHEGNYRLINSEENRKSLIELMSAPMPTALMSSL